MADDLAPPSGPLAHALFSVFDPMALLDGYTAGLFGATWLGTGAAAVLAGLLGAFGGTSRLVVLVGGVFALAVGLVLVRHRRRRTSAALDGGVLVGGSLALALMVAWSGAAAAAGLGVVYVFIATFTLIARRSIAAVVLPVAALGHAGALVTAGVAQPLGTWLMTWGAAGLTALLTAGVVQALRRALARLRRAEAHRDDFVAVTSHELRTPLTGVLTAGETLLARWHDLDDADRLALVQVMQRHGRRQLRLVDDLLGMRSATADAPAPLPLDLAAHVRDVVGDVDGDVAVDVEAGISVMADSRHLRQVLTNLVSNALHYGGAPVEVVAVRVVDRVRIDVVDHGDGIEGGFDSGVLLPWVQGDGGIRRRSSGVGLGLAVCRDLVERNDGELVYATTPGGGATIRVWLRATTALGQRPHDVELLQGSSQR